MAKQGFLKRTAFKAAYILGVLLVLLVAGEITARAMGFRPWHPQIQTLTVNPEGRFFQDDSLLGYKGRPGQFELLLQDSLGFQVTHNAAGWRICPGDSIQSDKRPEIWIFGCSFTHGYGVNDSECYPCLLQTRFPNYHIQNFGMDGFGTLQNWLQMQKAIPEGKKPAVVILAYGAFHDQRNTANRYWQKALHGQQIADDISYPYIRLNDNDSLIVHYGKLGYHLLPFQDRLPLLALMEEKWNKSEDDGLRSKYVTEVLIQKMHKAALQMDAKFVLAGIYRHPDTEKMLNIFHLANVLTTDIGQDLAHPELRILPGNGHPNAHAHRLMANQLAKYLLQNGIVSETR